ncbi:fractalkine [Numida meleagris]|uniref:fractalkine n=1 Tax=Numida meleagris TaxID=8996 RepID=UPI000B3D83A9|nr:fractalkine [Numida meleagris]XP_021263733.1 fractalkine [Numida meleagris]
MRLPSLLILFVLRILWLAAMAGGQPKARLKCSKWCGSFHSAIDETRIKSYRWTEPQCTPQAIIFTTKKSKEICANPKEEWVKKITQKLDREKALAASPLPRAATSPAAAVPEEPGIFHKHVGLQEPAPPQTTAATLERAPVPAASTEAASEPTMHNGTHFSAGPSPVTSGVVTQSGVISEANREPLTPTVHSTAAGVAPSQPSPNPTAPARGSDSTEEPVGDATHAAGDVHHTATTSNLDPASISKGLGRPGLSTNNPLDPVSARGSTSDTALSSALPSILNSTGVSTFPSTPEAAPVPTQNPTTAIDEGRSVHANKNFCSSAFDAGTFDHSMPSGKEGPPDTLAFTSQMFPGQARAQATRSPSEPPAPSLLSGSQMPLIIPVIVAGGLIACSVAAVWLYIKFRIRPETMSREMVQGLLYQKEGYQNNVYPMEVI